MSEEKKQSEILQHNAISCFGTAFPMGAVSAMTMFNSASTDSYFSAIFSLVVGVVLAAGAGAFLQFGLQDTLRANRAEEKEEAAEATKASETTAAKEANVSSMPTAPKPQTL